jgi:squalene-hopene/tetraprenyl-beta-curcumene cyclase
MTEPLDVETIRLLQSQLTKRLLALTTSDGNWAGRLSSSALSTATACLALKVCLTHSTMISDSDKSHAHQLIAQGLQWLHAAQNSDGGWGDTSLSISNISTSMLCHATLTACVPDSEMARFQPSLLRSQRYIDEHGGIEAVEKRYGKDKTFSVPIMTHCAIAGLVPWKLVPQLPFELSAFPAAMYAALQMPVVSYALPALIAIGNVKFHHQPWASGLLAPMRALLKPLSLKKLVSIQPSNGGFLEATPLTSFVLMSLASAGLSDHPVAQKCFRFIVESFRADGSWPIDTNLATWVTTLSINALPAEAITPGHAEQLTLWLLQQQYRTVHPYTNAAPGGWAWTNLEGGVPDADDTPGAMLALSKLQSHVSDKAANPNIKISISEAQRAGGVWLLDLQNRDGGWPTFCKGWGTLPFDRSANDITAHALCALHQLELQLQLDATSIVLRKRIQSARQRGFQYLARQQRVDGSWLPLWFGNQYGHDDENPVFGTARVLKAYSDPMAGSEVIMERGRKFLLQQQNADGGWGGAIGLPSTIEETSLVLEALAPMISDPSIQLTTDITQLNHGWNWLKANLQEDQPIQAQPVGFYFAKLWYYEDLYPIIFTLGATTNCLESYFGSSKKA